MKKFAIIILLFALPMVAQQSPQLSTSDKVSIQTLEKVKQEALKQYQDAQQTEGNILQEFSASHKGYSVNPQTFAVIKDEPKKETPKEAPKK